MALGWNNAADVWALERQRQAELEAQQQEAMQPPVPPALREMLPQGGVGPDIGRALLAALQQMGPVSGRGKVPQAVLRGFAQGFGQAQVGKDERAQAENAARMKANEAAQGGYDAEMRARRQAMLEAGLGKWDRAQGGGGVMGKPDARVPIGPGEVDLLKKYGMWPKSVQDEYETNGGALTVSTLTSLRKGLSAALRLSPTGHDLYMQGIGKKVAGAVEAGEQPPTFGRALEPSVRGALADTGFNLSESTNEWIAKTQATKVANAVVPTRFRLAINRVGQQAQYVKELAKQFAEAVPGGSGQIPLVNGIVLDAAVNGAPGFTQAQRNIARKLKQQINIIQPELSVMYRNGNSPTDASDKHAREMISQTWGEAGLLSALEAIDKDVEMAKVAAQEMPALIPAKGFSGFPEKQKEGVAPEETMAQKMAKKYGGVAK